MLARGVSDTQSRMPVLLMTSLMQTDGKKMAALRVVFTPLSNKDEKWSEKLQNFIYFLFHSSPPCCRLSSVRSLFTRRPETFERRCDPQGTSWRWSAV